MVEDIVWSNTKGIGGGRRFYISRARAWPKHTYVSDGTYWLVKWRTPNDPKEAACTEEIMLNLCYARYGRGDKNA